MVCGGDDARGCGEGDISERRRPGLAALVHMKTRNKHASCNVSKLGNKSSLGVEHGITASGEVHVLRFFCMNFPSRCVVVDMGVSRGDEGRGSTRACQ